MSSLTTAKQPAKPKSRSFKIHYASYKGVGNFYPVIRLGGKYLQAFGFHIGSNVQVEFREDIIVIRKVGA